MGSVRYAQILVGVSVCAGALFLNGSALADSNHAVTPDQLVPVHMNSTATPSVNSSSSVVESSTNTIQTTTVPTKADPPSSGPSGPSANGQIDESVKPKNGQPVAPDQGSQSNGNTASNGTPLSKENASGSPQTGTLPSTTLSVQSPNHDGSAASNIDVVTATPIAPHDVVFHSYQLPIQPAIVSYHSVVLPGLAVPVPHSDTSKKTPLPPKANGALQVVTAALAGFLVPQPFTPHLPAVDAALLVLIFAVIFTMPLGSYVFNYGWWLRLGGLVTAPRSDTPPVQFSTLSLFATPLSLGYVTVPPHGT